MVRFYEAAALAVMLLIGGAPPASAGDKRCGEASKLSALAAESRADAAAAASMARALCAGKDHYDNGAVVSTPYSVLYPNGKTAYSGHGNSWYYPGGRVAYSGHGNRWYTPDGRDAGRGERGGWW
ncbi:MAG: hypothetical protein HY553_21075 [Elusimicrobia bacterium]|nr:hypothetical protein [Elusimicrobiota bacterium]